MKSSDRGRGALRVAHLDTGRSMRGGQIQVLMLMEGLERRGHSCVLLAPPGPLLERARRAGLTVLAWRARADWDLLALIRAWRALVGVGPDVVHCHDARAHALGSAAARLAGVPAVVVSRRVAFPPRGPLAGLRYGLGVDRFLCVSQNLMETLRTAGVPASRLAWVPGGVVSEPPAAGADLRELIGAPRAAPVIGTVAALTAEKRHEDLLRAAPRVLAAVPEAHFAWMGEGPRRAALERLRVELGLDRRVHLLGFRDDVRGLIAQCTVAALASESEGFPTSLVGAQVDGVPVVATAVGGVPEVVRDGVTGRLVPSHAPDRLADALIEVLTNRALRDGWSRNARDAAREFHIDRTVERTIEEYRSVFGHPLRTA